MKTILLPKWCVLTALGLAGVFNTANAQILYSDGFSGSASGINGRTPDTADVGGALWNSAVTTQFAVDGSGLGILTSTVPIASANNGAGPSLPFKPDGISTYVLSIDAVAFGDANSGHWLALAFLQNNNGSTFFDDGLAAIVIKPNLEIDTYYGNTGGTYGALVNKGLYTVGTAVANYSITLNSATGDVSFKQNNTVLGTGTLTPAQISTIGGVMFGAGQGTPVGLQYDNFSLSVAPAPEPGTMALAGFGGFLLLFWRRRLT